ncbi:hypothetical protein V492_00793 [Pseudogymnoascus sp. VKM F-4246]|nr:hypothetical protein V492_00793 [Pseudogymnoascus sp. VKM F-4246]
MSAPSTTVDTIAKCSTLNDYVQFQKWHKKECFSDDEKFQVSASYAMAIIFHRHVGGYKTRRGVDQKLSEIAPSFFITNDKVRLGCFNYGHGIVYEGCWVTYDDKVMRGSSTRDLPIGKSFNVLCDDSRFIMWFTKVLDGVYEKYDFDTLPHHTLISLTSPNTPGSLASDKPAGLSPSAGLSLFPRLRLQLGPRLQDEASASQGEAASTSLSSNKSLETLPKDKEAKSKIVRLPIGKNAQAAVEQTVAASTNEAEKTTPAPDDSQSDSRASVEPLTASQPSDKAVPGAKRKSTSSLTKSSEKRPKTSSANLLQELIDLCGEGEENARSNPGDPQSSISTAQYEELMKENARLKQSESRAAKKAKEYKAEIKELTEDNRDLRMENVRAVSKGDEALAKLRAANRANEELGGNEGVLKKMEEYLQEITELKVALACRVDGTGGTADEDEDAVGGIKNEGGLKVTERGEDGEAVVDTD